MHLAALAFLGLLGLAATSVLYRVIYEKFFSPLRHIPGPWYTAFTNIRAIVAGPITKRKAQYIHNLHMTYGPFVRVAPREVIVMDVESLKQIHRMGTPFLKTEMYKFLSVGNPGRPPYGLFQETDPKIHQGRRKLMSNGFALRSLRQSWSDLVRRKASRAVDQMQAHAKASETGDVDVLGWWISMAADVVSELAFGKSFDMLDQGKRNSFFEAAIAVTPFNMLSYQLPLLHKFLLMLPIPKLQWAMTGNTRLAKQGAAAVADSYNNAHSENIFTRILAEAEKEGVHMPRQQMVVEASSLIFAGTDTTSNTLTYLIYSVLANPDLQKALEEELAPLDEPLLDEQLEQLPVLAATIKETLRLYCAAPNGLPRRTPAGGAHLGGYFIPEGTVVTTQAWSYHRNPEFYPEPEKFDYTRWLSPDSLANSPGAQASFMAFGMGSRVCIGRHLAEMELRMGTALFFRRCRGARLAPATTPESMVVDNVFVIEPHAGACRVMF